MPGAESGGLGPPGIPGPGAYCGICGWALILGTLANVVCGGPLMPIWPGGIAGPDIGCACGAPMPGYCEGGAPPGPWGGA
jgi:hypothetical protein